MKKYFVISCYLPLLTYLIITQGTASNWEEQGLYGGQINTLAISTIDPNLIFAGSWAGDGLFKSTDGGIHWESIDYFRNREVFSIAYGGDQRKSIWVAFNTFLAKSIDGGQSWHTCFSTEAEGRFCYSIVIHPHDGNTVYVGCSGPHLTEAKGTIFKTTDGGISWQRLPLTADYSIQDIAIHNERPLEVWAVSGREFANQGSIYNSSDGGAHWTRISTGDLEETWFDEIVLTNDHPPTVIVGGGKGIYRSPDGGLSWSRPNIEGWYENSCCRALTLNPSQTQRVYAQTASIFSKSFDGGAHWDSFPSQVDSAPLELLSLLVDPQHPSLLYGGDICLGVTKSENEGMEWARINSGLKANHIFRTAISPHNSEEMVACTLTGFLFRQEENQWKALSYSPSYCAAFDPHDSVTLFAGFDGWLGRFSLSGVTPLEVEAPFPHHTINTIAITTSPLPSLFAGTESYTLDRGEIYKSTDGGKGWTRVLAKSAPFNDIKIDPHNPSTIYAGSGLFYAPIIMGNLYKSTDGGSSWQPTPLGDMVINTLALDYTHPETIYAGSGAPDSDSPSGVFKSLDGGLSWQWLVNGLPLGSPVVDIELDPCHPEILYTATFNQGIFISRDGGQYWTPLGMYDYWVYDLTPSWNIPPPLPVNFLSLPLNKIYTGTGSGLYRYSNAGTGFVTGIITDNTTGKGITGARVMTNTGGIARSLEGAYLLVASAGNCTISVSLEGYSTSSRSLAIFAGKTVSVDFTLTPLSPLASISGTVIDCQTKCPLPGATILTIPKGYSTRSREEGEFLLEDVIPGTYSLSAFRGGYSATREDGISVSEGKVQYVALSLSPLGTATLQGRVVDASSGEAMEGAEIQLEPGGLFTTSDSAGTYLISEIKTGGYSICATSEGYVPYLKDHLNVKPGETISLDIELHPCPFTLVGLSRHHLETLRSVRDKRLLPTPEGRRLISLFYKNAPSLSHYLRNDTLFREQCLELLSLLLPTIEMLLHDTTVSLTSGFISAVEEQLTDLSTTPEINQMLKELTVLLHQEEGLKRFGIILAEPPSPPSTPHLKKGTVTYTTTLQQKKEKGYVKP